MVASISSSTVSKWADSVFTKLDTKNQGYIEKADLQDALSKAGDAGKGGAANADDTFSALDGDSDGKVTKSELTEAMTKLSGQLNAQFDASRAGGGGQGGPGGPGGAGGPHGPHGGHAGGAESTDGASATGSTGSASTSASASTDYVASADTDGDGTVSDTEQAAYDKQQASDEQAPHQKDPMRELAHALHLLKAYAENGGSADSSPASAAAAASTATSVSVEA